MLSWFVQLDLSENIQVFSTDEEAFTENIFSSIYRVAEPQTKLKTYLRYLMALDRDCPNQPRWSITVWGVEHGSHHMITVQWLRSRQATSKYLMIDGAFTLVAGLELH